METKYIACCMSRFLDEKAGPVEVLRFFKNDEKVKWPYLRLLTIHVFILGTVKDTVSIFYSTKNQGHGCCVGGDMVIFEKLENFNWTGKFPKM